MCHCVGAMKHYKAIEFIIVFLDGQRQFYPGIGLNIGGVNQR